MKFYKSKSGNLEVSFKSNINRETSSSSTSLGELYSTMELWQDGSNAPTGIEWCISDEDGYLIEHADIGLVFDGNTLEDYDGIFALPSQAIALIRKSGYSVSSDFED